MGQKFHSEFKYVDSINKGVTIQNSYPKGGQKYTSPNGKEYVYVIFWSCITNKSVSNLELKIDFLSDSFTTPSSPNINFNLYLPQEEMTFEKELLQDYGLNLKLFLDENINNHSKLKTTVKPNDSYLFYTVAISNQGVDGVVQSGFELENQDLVYKINGYKINCGRIDIIK
jgi:hypothetical protein